jgi:hypothetical protein
VRLQEKDRERELKRQRKEAEKQKQLDRAREQERRDAVEARKKLEVSPAHCRLPNPSFLYLPSAPSALCLHKPAQKRV